MIKNSILGLLISIADLVPGISGGTIMIITGKYYKIIHYVNEMMKLNFSKESCKFIFPILLGWILGIISFSKLISYLMSMYKVEMYGLFSGLIIGGVLYLFKNIEEKSRKSFLIMIISFAISLGVFIALKKLGRASVQPNTMYLFLSALLASAAMPLPGISGSTVFLILGVYDPIIKSISRSNMEILLPVFFGILIGWFLTVKILNTLFEKAQSTIYQILLGITLAGAIKVLPISSSIYPYIFILVGMILSFGIELYYKK